LKPSHFGGRAALSEAKEFKVCSNLTERHVGADLWRISCFDASTATTEPGVIGTGGNDHPTGADDLVAVPNAGHAPALEDDSGNGRVTANPQIGTDAHPLQMSQCSAHPTPVHEGG
jgi:hypothetical protein